MCLQHDLTRFVCNYAAVSNQCENSIQLQAALGHIMFRLRLLLASLSYSNEFQPHEH